MQNDNGEECVKKKQKKEEAKEGKKYSEGAVFFHMY